MADGAQPGHCQRNKHQTGFAAAQVIQNLQRQKQHQNFRCDAVIENDAEHVFAKHHSFVNQRTSQQHAYRRQHVMQHQGGSLMHDRHCGQKENCKPEPNADHANAVIFYRRPDQRNCLPDDEDQQRCGQQQLFTRQCRMSGGTDQHDQSDGGKHRRSDGKRQLPRRQPRIVQGRNDKKIRHQRQQWQDQKRDFKQADACGVGGLFCFGFHSLAGWKRELLLCLNQNRKI